MEEIADCRYRADNLYSVDLNKPLYDLPERNNNTDNGEHSMMVDYYDRKLFETLEIKEWYRPQEDGTFKAIEIRRHSPLPKYDDNAAGK